MFRAFAHVTYFAFWNGTEVLTVSRNGLLCTGQIFRAKSCQYLKNYANPHATRGRGAIMTEKLEAEKQYRHSQGQECLSMPEYLARYAAIGYRFDRSCDARSIARYMTGDRAGQSYPCLSLYPVQADNGLSAWNVEARRDSNYQAFRALRATIFSVSQGAIVEI